MDREHKPPNRFSDTPRDRPHREGSEHANLERPGAMAHPRAEFGHRTASNWATGWRLD